MAQYNSDWDDLGKSIQDIVDKAVNSQDYQKLNQTIRQAVGKAVDLGSEAVRKAVDGSGCRQSQSTQTRVEKKNLPVLYGSTGGKMTKGVLKIVGGGFVTLPTFAILFLVALAGLSGWLDLSLIWAVIGLAILGGGIGLLGSGIGTVQKVNRFKTYRRVLGDKTYCTLERLARSVGKSVKFVRRELEKMIGEGLFLEGHLDREGTQLITSHETWRYFEQSRLQLEQRQQQEAAEQAKKAASPHTPQVQEVLDKGNAFIAEIRRCNDLIPGDEVSAKIDRMENIVRRIFQRAETEPKIVPDLKKLMDYYLPMTVKLLNAYADMDAQPIQGETIAASKREIEGTLDTLNLAFENLLDDLFRDTALDVSSDISVLQTLLAQEGLTDDGLTKPRGE